MTNQRRRSSSQCKQMAPVKSQPAIRDSSSLRVITCNQQAAAEKAINHTAGEQIHRTRSMPPPTATSRGRPSLFLSAMSVDAISQSRASDGTLSLLIDVTMARRAARKGLMARLASLPRLPKGNQRPHPIIRPTQWASRFPLGIDYS